MFEDARERKLVEAAGRSSGTTTQPFVKLATGVLAGSTAVLLPRVLALSAQSDAGDLVFFPPHYFLLAASVGVFLGLVMLVFEYQVPAKPRDTFMAALGIPAIISGALGTASGADGVARAEREAAKLRQAVSAEQGIAKDGAFQNLEPLDANGAPQAAPKTSRVLFPLVASAYAGEPLGQVQGEAPVRFGIHMEQPKYVVVLREAASAEEAMREERKLREQLPGARAVKADRGYFVILGGPPATETEALLAAARAKKVARVKPVLVEVGK